MADSALNTTKNRLMMIGYILLFIATVGFDQTTKFHAQQQYMVWSHETDLRSYRGDSHRVMTLGVSPSLTNEKGMDRAQISNNWLDFHLTYVRNPGAAWGSFANAPEKIRLWLFYAITVLVSGMIIYLFRSAHPGQRMQRTALTFVLAGAAGNFVDRLLLRYVIDWLHFHWRIFGWEYSFPVFNWADVAINVGIGLMILDSILHEVALRKRLREQSPQATQVTST